MIGIVPWFFIEREWCRSIGYIQYGGIGKLLEGGGVEAWKVEVLRLGRWRCWGNVLNVFSWLTLKMFTQMISNWIDSQSPLVCFCFVFLFLRKLKETGLRSALTPPLNDKTSDVDVIFHGLINTMNQSLENIYSELYHAKLFKV